MKLLSNIEKLKILTETLMDRDSLRLKVLNLFDVFCNDFPIPMNAWIVNEDLKIVAKKGCLISEKSGEEDLRNIFENGTQEKNILMHEKALEGEIVTYAICENDKTFLTKLIPSQGSQTIIFGVSMDISSFVNMIDVFEKYCDDEKNEECKLIKNVKNDKLYEIISKERE